MRKRLVAIILILLMAYSGMVSAAAIAETLIPVGKTVGITLKTDGVVVVDFDETESLAKSAGFKKGDIITAVNGTEITDAIQLQNAIGAEKSLTVTVLRGEDTLEIPVENSNQKLGMAVREGISGIGTVTFYDPATDTYGALGHGVNEPDARVLLPLDSGALCPASVVEVDRGSPGHAGVLHGAFETNKILGTVEQNTDHGIFGQGGYDLATRPALEVADYGSIQLGNATILANVDGDQVGEYQVKILQTANAPKANGRDLVLQITDPRLLKATNGIVQGMSGSPILQNGKIIGAVTHVFVNEPNMGYGIFMENMLKAAA